MKSNLKNMIASLSLVAVMATGQVFAYDETEKKSLTQHAVPPAVYPPGDEAFTFFIGAAYTFWQPFQGGTNIAYANGSSDGTTTGLVYGPAFNAQSGFKVNLGANVDHDGWAVRAEYTWFYNNPGTKVINLTSPAGVTYLIDAETVEDANGILGLQTKFKNQFNRIDLTLDRAFHAGHYLTFRPFIGLLGAWDTQNLYADVQSNQAAIAFDANTQSYRNSQSWWGIGPYGGLESSFYFTNDWALFLSSGVSMLLSNHNASAKSYAWSSSTSSTITTYEYNNKQNFNSVEPMIESALGLRWDMNWPNECALRLQLAWELQTYFQHSGLQIFPSDILQNYSMQGLTLGLRVNF
jgi:hypothetical protein